MKLVFYNFILIPCFLAALPVKASACLLAFQNGDVIDLKRVKRELPLFIPETAQTTQALELSQRIVNMLKALQQHFEWLSHRANVDLFREEARFLAPALTLFDRYQRLVAEQQEALSAVDAASNRSASQQTLRRVHGELAQTVEAIGAEMARLETFFNGLLEVYSHLDQHQRLILVRAYGILGDWSTATPYFSNLNVVRAPEDVQAAYELASAFENLLERIAALPETTDSHDLDWRLELNEFLAAYQSASLVINTEGISSDPSAQETRWLSVDWIVGLFHQALEKWRGNNAPSTD